MQYYPRNYWGQNSDSTLWVEFTPKIITFQNSKDQRNKGGISSSIDSRYPIFGFLLQSDFSFSQNHSWEAFDTVEGQLMEFQNKVSTGVRAAFNPRGHGSRADMPVTFTDSPRREYSFDFELASQGDNYADVYYPVDTFLKMASAEPTGSVNFRFPNVFGVRTVTGSGKEVSVVNVNNAAITSVQPAFEGPYKEGYPTRCKLTLTITDLAPLFRSSYSVGYATVTTGSRR